MIEGQLKRKAPTMVAAVTMPMSRLTAWSA